MKYIIELEDEPLVRKSALHGEDAVYRAKGFNSLVFDKLGLEKLKPYTEPDRHQIEDEVWELAREISTINCEDYIKCFDIDDIMEGSAFTKYTYQEAKEKYEAWKNQKDEIRVGCEVHHKELPELKIYVTDMDDNSFGGFALCRVEDVCDYGDRFSECNVYQYKPTGRVLPNIVKLLKKMKGESRT